MQPPERKAIPLWLCLLNLVVDVIFWLLSTLFMLVIFALLAAAVSISYTLFSSNVEKGLQVGLFCFGSLTLTSFLVILWWVLRREKARARQRQLKEERQRRIEEEQRYFARIKTLEQLYRLTPREFEHFVAKLFEKMGYIANVTSASADEGVDLFLEKGTHKIVVQCKRTKGSIGQPTVRDFYGTMIHHKADQGYIVTTGTFSLPAQHWAEGKQIHLVDGIELIDWLESLPPDEETENMTT